jgi:hypothetical protein
MLVHLLYASRPAANTTGELVESILTKSRAHNRGAGITGILCYTEDLFIQVLEGSRAEVSNLYLRIARDPRHRNVHLLSFQEISERRFHAWTMGQVNLAKINPGLLLRYSERAELDPFSTTARATLALLDELMATAAIADRTS